ncbi:MAG: acylphosphatase [Candidatus Marsarchaeota archaeon]|nr:acylphosphatase [Candidatus Marsarchaeota archaeon]MCL5418788.1 acylphosphatase [Candidatus Marsarchaeota archaeon]
MHGFVQGVGYRAYIKRVADSYGICGYAKNMPDGSVEIVAKGDAESIARFESSIKISMHNGPEVIAVEKSETAEAEEGVSALKGFEVR